MNKKASPLVKRRRGFSHIADQIDRNTLPSGYTEQQLRAVGPDLAKKLREFEEWAKTREPRLLSAIDVALRHFLKNYPGRTREEIVREYPPFLQPRIRKCLNELLDSNGVERRRKQGKIVYFPK